MTGLRPPQSYPHPGRTIGYGPQAGEGFLARGGGETVKRGRPQGAQALDQRRLAGPEGTQYH